MPEAKKVSWAQLRIGVMAAVAMAILGVLIFLLTGSGDIFTSYATLYTYMDDSAAMAPGTVVRLNGITEGTVGKLLKDDVLYNELVAATREMNKIVASVNSGKGTLGRLLHDDDLYQELRSPIKRIDAMLNDMQQGQGTLGKLLKDPALFEET